MTHKKKHMQSTRFNIQKPKRQRASQREGAEEGQMKTMENEGELNRRWQSPAELKKKPAGMREAQALKIQR